MFPINKILCPTDFSEPSYEALKAGNEIARRFSAQLLLVHVISPVPVMPTGGGLPPSDMAQNINFPQLIKEMRAIAEKSLQEVVQERLDPAISSKTMVLQGYPADEITALAEREQLDMIIIATHGLTGWRRFVFGSVTEKVVRTADCPVLTIRAPKEAEAEAASSSGEEETA